MHTYGHVGPRAHKGVGHGVNQLSAHPKVTNLDLTPRVHQHVRGLHVCKDSGNNKINDKKNRLLYSRNPLYTKRNLGYHVLSHQLLLARILRSNFRGANKPRGCSFLYIAHWLIQRSHPKLSIPREFGRRRRLWFARLSRLRNNAIWHVILSRDDYGLLAVNNTRWERMCHFLIARLSEPLKDCQTLPAYTALVSPVLVCLQNMLFFAFSQATPGKLQSISKCESHRSSYLDMMLIRHVAFKTTR